MIIVEWDPPKEVTTQFLFIRSYDVYYKRLGGTVNAEGSWGHKTTNALLTGMEVPLVKYLPFIPPLDPICPIGLTNRPAYEG